MKGTAKRIVVVVMVVGVVQAGRGNRMLHMLRVGIGMSGGALGGTKRQRCQPDQQRHRRTNAKRWLKPVMTRASHNKYSTRLHCRIDGMVSTA